MTRSALVVGSGVAALSCARLFIREGWRVKLSLPDHTTAPTLLMTSVASRLLRDIWCGHDDLTSASHSISGRRVLWEDRRPADVAQSGTVVASAVLSARMLAILREECPNSLEIETMPAEPSMTASDAGVDWIVDAGGRSTRWCLGHTQRSRITAGRRRVLATAVELKPQTNVSLCYTEAVADGWLFLMPTGSGRGVLQGMVPSAPAHARKQLQRLLGQSSLIAAAVCRLEETVTMFDAFPQLTLPMSGDKWIAVGESAVAFDPLAGDGVSNAMRGVILAVAALNGVSDGLPIAATQDHYRRRLSDVFSSHVRSCIQHYQGPFPSDEWSREIETMRSQRTIRAGRGDYAFGLDGFRLVPLGRA